MSTPTLAPTGVSAANSNASSVLVAFTPVSDAGELKYVAAVTSAIDVVTLDVAGMLVVPPHTTLAPQTVVAGVQNAFQVATDTLTTATFTLSVYDNNTPSLTVVRSNVAYNAYADGCVTEVVRQTAADTGPLTWSLGADEPIPNVALNDGLLTIQRHAQAPPQTVSAVVHTAYQLATATPTVAPFTLAVFDNNTPALAAPDQLTLFTDLGVATTSLRQLSAGTCNLLWTVGDDALAPIPGLVVDSGSPATAILAVDGDTPTRVNQPVRVVAQTDYQQYVDDWSSFVQFDLTYLRRVQPVQAPTVSAVVSGPSNVSVSVTPIVDDAPYVNSYTCNGYSPVLGYALANVSGGPSIQTSRAPRSR